MARETLFLRLPAATKAKLKEVAQEKGLTVTALLNVLLNDFLKDYRG